MFATCDSPQFVCWPNFDGDCPGPWIFRYIVYANHEQMCRRGVGRRTKLTDKDCLLDNCSLCSSIRRFYIDENTTFRSGCQILSCLGFVTLFNFDLLRYSNAIAFNDVSSLIEGYICNRPYCPSESRRLITVSIYVTTIVDGRSISNYCFYIGKLGLRAIGKRFGICPYLVNFGVDDFVLAKINYFGLSR